MGRPPDLPAPTPQTRAARRVGQLTIGPADAADHPALIELWEAAVRATHAFLGEADIAAIRQALRTDYLPAVSLLAARDGHGRLLGFAGTAGDMLEMLFVAPDRHGHGIGGQLLRHVVAERGIRRVDVNEQNPTATAFYLAHGFRQNGRSATDGAGRPFPLLHLQLAGDATP